MENSNKIFFYCERTSDIFWAEPVNAVSNFFFIIAGMICLFLGKKNNNKDVIILSISLLFIGLFSFLYHTLSTPLFGLLDVLSILVFSLLYFFYFNKSFFSLNNPILIFLTFLFFFYLIIFSFLFSLINLEINGSEQYFPLVLILIIYFFIILVFKKNYNLTMLASILILISSIFFRSIDQIICDFFSIGSHFVWHFLNSVSLGIFIIVILNNGKKV